MEFKLSTTQHLNNLVSRIPDLESTRDALLGALDIICKCYKSGGKLLICGNGGSASDSEHIVGELMKSFILPRRLPQSEIDKLQKTGIGDWAEIASNLQQGIPAIALTANTPLSTAILNDTDPNMIFAQKAYVLSRPGDVLVGLSTSGNAKNVSNALKVAKAFGLSTIGFSGSKASEMDNLCDVIVKAPSTETYRVQEYHLPLYHCLCLMIEEELWGE